MRPTQTAEELLGSRSRIAVLRVLRGVSVPLNASQISARTGLSRPAVATVLDNLAAAGIVQASSAGRANVHVLVRDNVYVERIIEPVFSGEEAIADELVKHLRARFQELAVSVILFGSYARGDQDLSSDVDVVLVAADSHTKGLLESAAYNLMGEFYARFGAHLSPLVYDREEAADLEARAPDLFASLQEDGLTICGLSAWEWNSNA